MPIEGKFYTNSECQVIFRTSKQNVANYAQRYRWQVLTPGLYCAEDVEKLMTYRRIEVKEPVMTWKKKPNVQST